MGLSKRGRNRELGWDGCVNVRDLGGIPTQDGGMTRWGAVVRGDSPYRLSEAGRGALTAYGIRTLIDLRWPEERAADPTRDLPVTIIHLPLAGDQRTPEAEHDEQPLRAGETMQERLSAHYLANVDRYQVRIASAISAIGDAPPGGVLVHCMSGKGRTGLVCGLLLRLAGVSISEAAADYEATTLNLDRVRALWVADATDDQTKSTRRVAPLAAPAATMITVLEAIESRHGSVAAYLIDGGAHPDLIAAAQRLLRDRP